MGTGTCRAQLLETFFNGVDNGRDEFFGIVLNAIVFADRCNFFNGLCDEFAVRGKY